MRLNRIFRSALFTAAVTAPLLAQAPTIAVDAPDCLPNEENATLTARVSPEPGGSSVRLYFRRLNPVGAFYYDEMIPAGGGSYWTVFPKPEDRQQHLLTDDWWEVLQDRDWMSGHDREWLEEWLEQREEEATEYYVAVFNGQNELLARSDTRLVEVRSPGECQVTLNAHQNGWARNLTVGETTEVQAGRCLFHWLCDGVVTRISWQGILHPDQCCRACVVGGMWPLASGGVVAAGVITTTREASPEQP